MASCPICYEPLDTRENVTTGCGHAFCAECLAQWKANKRTCPMCRSEETWGLVTSPAGDIIYGQEADGDVVMCEDEFDLVAWGCARLVSYSLACGAASSVTPWRRKLRTYGGIAAATGNYGSSDTGTLAGDRAAHHVTRGCVRHRVTSYTASRYEQPLRALRDQTPQGNLKIPSGCRKKKHSVPVEELGKDPDRVAKPRLASHVLLPSGPVSRRLYACPSPRASSHSYEPRRSRTLGTRERRAFIIGKLLRPPLHLSPRQIFDIGSIDLAQMDQIKIPDLSVRSSAGPGAPEIETRGDLSRFFGVVELGTEIWSRKIRLLTVTVLYPVSAPVRVSSAFAFHVLQETLSVDAPDVQHARDSHGLLAGNNSIPRPQPCGQDQHLLLHRLSSSLVWLPFPT